MLDIKLIRENPNKVKDALFKRGMDISFDEFLKLESKRRELIQETEGLRAKKNETSAKIPILKKKGEDVQEIFKEMKNISNRIKEIDAKLNEVNKSINDFVAKLPNIPDDDVKAGGKENNEIIHTWKEKPIFDFEAKNHVDLVKELDLIDYERGAKLGGNGFWIYKGLGARLEWALINYFLEEHEKDGYEFILPPHILNYDCGFTAGQFPKFEEDVFWLEENENKGYRQFILPTAETALVNLHRGEIIDENTLPRKYYAYTPCYRKEAGSYRKEERGMIRGHQFNKVEMVQYTKPEKSDEAFYELLEKAKKLVEGLGLHYRVSKLAAGDCSASMAKTYDIEVWIPSMNEYKEVSSVSNSNDYQARRGKIRYRDASTNNTEFIHTLNASGLATSRLLPAILEQFQTKDNKVKIPEVLKTWINKDYLE